MQYTVPDFTGPLTSEQREVLDDLLMPGERILWATRPKASLFPWSHRVTSQGRASVTLGLCIFCCLAVDEAWRGLPQCRTEIQAVLNGEGNWVRTALLCLMLGVALLAVYLSGRYLVRLLLRAFMVRRHRRHTLYILTDSRALSVVPTPEGWMTASYSLDEDMILARRDRRAGGELIFRGVDTAQEEGWLGLPDRDEAERAIAAALQHQA